MPSYLGMDESLGFTLVDSPERLDLQARFSRLSRIAFMGVHFTRCKITNLCPAGAPGFPAVVVFEDCDFSGLSPEQRSLLRPHGEEPTNFCIGGV